MFCLVNQRQLKAYKLYAFVNHQRTPFIVIKVKSPFSKLLLGKQLLIESHKPFFSRLTINVSLGNKSLQFSYTSCHMASDLKSKFHIPYEMRKRVWKRLMFIVCTIKLFCKLYSLVCVYIDPSVLLNVARQMSLISYTSVDTDKSVSPDKVK